MTDEITNTLTTEPTPDDTPTEPITTQDDQPTENVTTESTIERVFKIGSTRIVETDSTRGKSVDEVRALLQIAHPEVKDAEVREKTKDSVLSIEFMPKAGRKG